MVAKKGMQERVKVVGRRGEIEPRWREEGIDMFVEFWHAWDGSWVGDEGRAEDANWRGGEGSFDGVVDIYTTLGLAPRVSAQASKEPVPSMENTDRR